MNAAADRRVRALELKAGKASRPQVAFVIWQRTRQEADATLEHALSIGAVKRGDPIILGVMPGPAPMPPARWTDALGMADHELKAIADLPATDRPFIGDVEKMTDAALSNAIVADLARATL